MPISNLNDIAEHWSSERVRRELQRSLHKGITAGCIFLAARVKELISVPAPRIRILGHRGKAAGTYYYRATTPATPGAPPRKLSGRLRTAQTYEVRAVGDEVEGRVGSNVIYARRLEEEQDHKYLSRALDAWRGQLGDIIEREAS